MRSSQVQASDMSNSDRKVSDPVQDELSLQERGTLLQIAHDAIVSALDQQEISLEPPNERLAQPRGVFTSLYLKEELRGCVGYVRPENSLYRAVAESARAAAFADTRFSPLKKEEAPQVSVELSVLSPLQSIAPEAVEVGRHGLLVTMDGYRGLLLPQVAVGHGWDRIKFLEQTCRKAGLPVDVWREGAIIEAFTAQVFGDKVQGR